MRNAATSYQQMNLKIIMCFGSAMNANHILILKKDLIENQKNIFVKNVVTKTTLPLAILRGYVLIAEKYAEALSKQCILLDGALKVLDALKGKIPMILVTNGLGRVQRGRLDRGNLWHYFHSVIISQEIGTQKPDPQMLFAALETLDGVQKEDVLMCGDSLTSDILAANRAGIDACWYNPKGKALPEDMHAEYEIRNILDLIPIVLT